MDEKETRKMKEEDDGKGRRGKWQNVREENDEKTGEEKWESKKNKVMQW